MNVKKLFSILLCINIVLLLVVGWFVLRAQLSVNEMRSSLNNYSLESYDQRVKLTGAADAHFEQIVQQYIALLRTCRDSFLNVAADIDRTNARTAQEFRDRLNRIDSVIAAIEARHAPTTQPDS